MKVKHLYLSVATIIMCCVLTHDLHAQQGKTRDTDMRAALNYITEPNKDNLENLRNSYARQVGQVERSGERPKPGLFAEYAVCLAKLGQYEEAAKWLKKEVTAYPCAAAYVEQLRSQLLPNHQLKSNTTYLPTLPDSLVNGGNPAAYHIVAESAMLTNLAHKDVEVERKLTPKEKKQAQKEKAKEKKKLKKDKEKARKKQQKAKAKAKKEKVKARKKAKRAKSQAQKARSKPAKEPRVQREADEEVRQPKVKSNEPRQAREQKPKMSKEEKMKAKQAEEAQRNQRQI